MSFPIKNGIFIGIDPINIIGTLHGYGSIPMKIPFLMGWTSIYLPAILMWTKKGYKVLTHCHITKISGVTGCFFFEDYNKCSYIPM